MKKIISTVLVCVFLLGCVFTLASCSKLLFGSYETGLDAVVASGNVTYDFKVFKYTKTTTNELLGKTSTTVEEGTFKITEVEEGKLEITFTYEVDGEKKTETLPFVTGEENGVKYVELGLVKYTEVKK